MQPPQYAGLYVCSDMAGDYWVIDTDYDTFASVYSCGDILGIVKIELAYILTREKNPSEETVLMLINIVHVVLCQSSILIPQVQLALDAFERNGITDLPWQYIANADDCVYDIEPSCSDSFPSQ